MSISARCRHGAAAAVVAWAVLAPVLAAPRRAAENYATVFGDRYDVAERFVRENGWMARELRLSSEETRVALAVVFPELIRFGALENAIQVRALEVLYVQHGAAYADFSIGRFQMKPSFAEQLERDAARLLTARERTALGIPAFDLADRPAAREQRILRLEDLAWQVRYLRLFMLAMDERYRGAAFASVEDRLRFWATAYNAGYASGEAMLRQKTRRRTFHTALLFPATTYCYADVAAFYFRRHRE